MITLQTIQQNYIANTKQLHKLLLMTLVDEFRDKPHIEVLDGNIAALDAMIHADRTPYWKRDSWPMHLEHKYKIGPLFKYRDAAMRVSFGHNAYSVNLHYPDLTTQSVYPEHWDMLGTRKMVKYYDWAQSTKVNGYAVQGSDTDVLYAKLEKGYKRWKVKQAAMERKNNATHEKGRQLQAEWDAAAGLPA